ncbi:DUF7527 domain-containing protein [Halostagnicola bangensis]
MDSRTQERVERWDSRPFTGGYNELSTLADNGFSGVVTASETWLFMLNGRVVGVVDGEIEAFEQASGTIYAAPHASLPLLCSMHAQGGETRANYYTNETPLSEVDQTLQDGSFTGYIELSEQVLSGDYYAVYYGGRRMAAAYIGNAERLLTGDEAFERAADEVGIYEVVDAEINVTDVPEGGSTRPASTTDDPQGSSAPQPPADSDSAPVAEPAPSTTDGSATTTDAAETGATADASSSASTEATAGSDPDEWADSSEAVVSDDATRPASASDLRETSDLTDPSGTEGTDSQPDQEPATDATDQPPTDRPQVDPEPTETDAGRTDESDGTNEPPDQQSSRSSSSADQSPESDSVPGEARRSSDPSATPGDSSPESEADVQAESEPEQSAPGTQQTQSESVTYDEDEEHDETVSESEEDGKLDARLKQEEKWRETRSIPSIDPEKSEHVEAIRRQSGQRPPERPQADGPARSESNASEPRDQSATEPSTTSEAAQDSTTAVEQEAPSRSSTRSPVSEQEAFDSESDSLEAAIDEYEQRIEALTQHARKLESRQETLETENANLEAERERLQAENQELTATVQRLRSKIDDLEAECEQLRNAEPGAGETTGFGGSNSGRQLSAHEALAGTNLFVRYASKSDSTLQSAHDGDGDQESVASNLQLEQHTSFDASDVTVAGQPYEEFLTDTIEYKFVDWLVETLLFEIRETGHANGLADLYDAIPYVDRAELHATISLEDDETDDVPNEVTFDVVAFDKMGNPLIVANLNDSRDPATEQMLAELEEAASAVTANYQDLGAAMVVTSSYFEPGALEVTEQATSSGFLSRGSKLSYVNLSRKQGYHLALVESRSSGFHMNVPEL